MGSICAKRILTIAIANGEHNTTWLTIIDIIFPDIPIRASNANIASPIITKGIVGGSSEEVKLLGGKFEKDSVRVNFYGGGGVGVQGNPVIGSDGSLLAVDLVHGGYGYQYPPIVDVDDDKGVGELIKIATKRGRLEKKALK